MFVFQPRDYQDWASTSLFAYYEGGKEGNPVIAMPTGTGKSVVIAALIVNILTTWNGQRILMLAPTKELVTQNAEKLTTIWPAAPLGICSASLNKFEVGRPVTFGTIGTVFNRRHTLGRIDLIFIDECHLVSDKEETQYRQLIDFLLELNPDMKVVGFSATPYRLGVGHITDGGVFTDVCFDSTTLDAFNWFIEQGYLVPLIPRPTTLKLETDGLKTVAGDYSEKSQQSAFDKEAITREAVNEMRELAHDRAKILVFATGIAHAEHIADELRALGESVVCIHSKSDSRDDDLEAFKTPGDNGARWCINFGVLTTGFDMPGLDCIAVIRVTKSPGLWVQILGRGTRPDYAPGFNLLTQEGRLQAIAFSDKQNCLILDFGHNTAVLGPINDPKLPKKKGQKGGIAPVKTCKDENTKAPTDPHEYKNGHTGPCGVWNHPSARHCVLCGSEFLFEVKFDTKTSNDQVLAGAYEKPVVNEYNVTRVTYEIHSKRDMPDSIRCIYYCGLRRFTSYVLPEHRGPARRKSEGWWMKHGGGSLPLTTREALEQVDALRVPKRIRVWENKKYPDILDWIMDDISTAPV